MRSSLTSSLLQRAAALRENIGAHARAVHEPCAVCGTVLDTTYCEPLQKVACPACQSVVVVQKQFGLFTLLEVAGTSGAGVVYRALDTASGDNGVAKP
jgi:hypothetical protein